MKTKPGVKQKAVFIFLLILGNALMALLTLAKEGDTPPALEISKIERVGYLNIRIKGNLKAELDPNLPVICIGKNSGAIVRSAFVLKEYRAGLEAESFLKGETQEEYLISLPKAQAWKILGNEVFDIYPHGLEVKNVKRKRNYELVY